ncbi:MAG: efflux RND transporter periplasmic adaptor subunit [Desulfobacteraceae bacterium]|nr:efflux RND transporter periplasmic adaptor subunit [Desulfobacteraceae bacterium]
MKRRILFAILGICLVIAVLAGIKTLQIRTMIDSGKKFVPPPETVTSAKVSSEAWETSLTSVGSLTAVQGVVVSAELAGKVARITFEAGTPVKKGDILLRQDTTSEEAQLPGAVSQANLTRANLKRADQLFKEGIISQADHDTAVANMEQARAQVDNIRATIAKKTIRAPFSGRLGIRQVNLGQILREGDPIVTLQALDPIYVDFTLPQQQLARVRLGQPVRITGDALPGETLQGKITAVSPQIDADTRNIKLQATLTNRAEKLRPGMFVNTAVGLPVRQKVLAIPATSVLYAPYRDSVFVIENGKENKGGGAGLVLRQQFIRLGEKRGDFVAVTEGLKEGETIVSTGVFKLRNGQSVVIDNKLAPDFQQAPKPENN